MNRTAREAAFFDEAARTPAPGAGDQPDRFIADLLARLPRELGGRRVLDLGCGKGELSRLLAARGACVVGVDASFVSLATACEPGSRLQADALALPFAGQSFDLVVGSLVLHHLPIAPAARELARVLRPRGRALFSENFGTNPLLRLARRWLAGRWSIPRLGTPDEKPLDRADLDCLRRHFAVELAFPDFLFFHLLDRQLFGYRRPAVNRLCLALDAFVHRGFPALRRYSYRGTLLLAPAARGSRDR